MRKQLIRNIQSKQQETEWTDDLKNTSATDAKLYRGVGALIESAVEQTDVDGLLKESGLDWEVQTADGIKFGPEYKFESPRDRVIYRLNPQKPDEAIHLGTVSTRWKPFQNKEVVQSFVTFCEKSQLTMERLGFLDEGRIIFAVARTDDSFILPGGDIVKGKLLLTNAHKSGRGARVDLMSSRMVCTNQLVLPVKLAGKVIAHTSNYSETRVLEILEAAKTGFNQHKEEAEFLASIPVETSAAHALIIKILGNPDKSLDKQPKAVQEVLNLYHGQGAGSEMLSAYQTAWGVTQSITEYYNHHSSYRGGNAGHINSLWLSSKRAKQEQALKQIVSAFR